MAEWAERVPAAIERAEREFDYMEGAITAGEVALAKALWEAHIGQYTSMDCSICAALRAFAEKVEAL